MGIQSVMLFVKDLDRMRAFYQDVLDLQPIQETRLDNWVEFTGDGVRFSLHAIPSAIASNIHIDSPPRPREQGGVKLTFAVRDVAATRERIAALGLPLLTHSCGATQRPSILKAMCSPFEALERALPMTAVALGSWALSRIRHM